MDVDPRATRKSGFRSMYREHYGLVWGAARRFGVADHQLDDAVQEAFIVAYRRLGSFDGESPKAWLYSITRRVASNYRRAERRATRRKDAVRRTHLVAQPASTDTTEAWQAVDGFITGLSERQREIFVLSELEGMTGAEVARSLGLRPSTTYDAIRTLRRRFVADVVDPPEPSRLQRMVRRDRPRPTARTWGALVAALPGSRVAGATGGSTLAAWTSLSVAGKTAVASIAAATVLVGGFVLTRDRSDPAPVPEAMERARSTARTEPAPQTRVAAVDPDDPAPTPTPVVPHEPTPTPPVPIARAGVAPPPPKTDPLADENAILREGTEALAAGNASRALTLADQHARDFPDSALSDLRTALRIESLCALGKHAQARGEARQFLVRRPGSPLAERIESACPKKTEGAP